MSPTPEPPYLPTNELVAVAWLRLVPALDGIVATSLPRDIEAWRESGFLQVTAIPGGRVPDPDLPRRLPVLQLDGWATGSANAQASSVAPPWYLANQLLEAVRAATEEAQNGRYGKSLVVKAGYLDARVQAAYLITEPSRVPDDPGGYARFTADLALDWVPA